MSIDTIPEKAASAALPVARIRAVAGIIVVILAFGWIWWRTVSHTPLMTIPPTRLPAHNGYTFYKRASEVVVNTNVLNHVTSPGRFALIMTSLRLELDSLERNRQALALVHEGLPLDYCQPPVRGAD